MSRPAVVVAGVDGSAHGEHALRWAVGLAQRLDGVVVAVYALGLLTTGPDGEPEPAEPHREELRRRLLDEWAQPLAPLGAGGRAELRDGNPVTALLECGRENDAFALVVGTRGAGGFPGLVLGSTSAQLTQHADRPVIVVPPNTIADGPTRPSSS